MDHVSYTQYKNSGIYWIGEIPAHWETIPVKHHFFSKKQVAGNLADNYERLALTLNGVIKRSKDDAEGLQPEQFETYQIVRKNSLIFKLIDLENIKTSRVGLSKWDGLVSPAYIILSSNGDILPNYAEKYFLNMWYERIFNMLGSVGVRSNLNKEDVLNLPIINPPLEEQRQIAKYLDKQTGKINATISKNEELIQLLEEKRVALINQVVTKGLNPEVPMKNSGIEWIGEIPEHWKIMKLKHNGSILGGYAFKSNDFTDFGVKAIKITNIQSMRFNWDESFYLPPTFLQKHSEFIINKGDIVFALTRPIISTGIKAAIYDENEPALANQRTGIFKKHTDSLLSPFLYYIIYSDYFKEDFKSKITATNQPNISPLDIGEIKITLPNIDEQKYIISYLNKETSKINKTINKLHENINFLKEYKTSLINQVVTGKVDVRGEEI